VAVLGCWAQAHFCRRLTWEAHGVVMSVRVDASVMPSLDAFDEEFGRERSDIGPPSKASFRISTVIGLALAAAAISAFALGWPDLFGISQSEPGATTARENPEAAIQRLAREVEELRQANRELAQAQQQAAATIAALQAGEQEKSSAFTGWYSDLGALTFGIASPADGVANATNGRRSATARARPREIPRRDDGPISLEPPQ
jgi:FtsZ-binding cell division protein ZapB